VSEPAKPTQTCERCGEWGCEPALHPEAGSELAMVATTGALLGGTLVGLLALPLWLRRFDPVDAPPGHPRRRLRQDRLATAVVSALTMATVTVAALVVAAVEHYDRGPSSAFTVAEAPREAGSELEEILRLIEEGSPAQAVVGMDQLLELAPELSAEEIGEVATVHQRVGAAAGWGDDRSHALREALRESDHAEAAAALAAAYPHIEDPVERGQILVTLGRCANPEALGRVIGAETERYRTPELAHLLNVGCVQHVAHELLALADAHPAERPGVYRALSEGCDYRPHGMRDAAGAAIAERWLALSSRAAAEQAAPATHWLAHALACADEGLLDRALETMPPAADEWARTEVAIASYRRGRIDLDTLLDRAAEDDALRRRLREHYEGSAPWRDAVLQEAGERRQPQDHVDRFHVLLEYYRRRDEAFRADQAEPEWEQLERYRREHGL
jgi:hypothetical protein